MTRTVAIYWDKWRLSSWWWRNFSSRLKADALLACTNVQHHPHHHHHHHHHHHPLSLRLLKVKGQISFMIPPTQPKVACLGSWLEQGGREKDSGWRSSSSTWTRKDIHTWSYELCRQNRLYRCHFAQDENWRHNSKWTYGRTFLLFWRQQWSIFVMIYINDIKS